MIKIGSKTHKYLRDFINSSLTLEKDLYGPFSGQVTIGCGLKNEAYLVNDCDLEIFLDQIQ
jgi:hypothetical protein